MSLDKKIITGLVGFFILISTYAIFTALVSIPREKIDAENARVQKEIDNKLFQGLMKEANYKDCKSLAFDVYSQNWDGACKIAKKGADCTLKTYTADRLNEDRENDLDTCLAIYKAN